MNHTMVVNHMTPFVSEACFDMTSGPMAKYLGRRGHLAFPTKLAGGFAYQSRVLVLGRFLRNWFVTMTPHCGTVHILGL